MGLQSASVMPKLQSERNNLVVYKGIPKSYQGESCQGEQITHIKLKENSLYHVIEDISSSTVLNCQLLKSMRELQRQRDAHLYMAVPHQGLKSIPSQ